MNRSILSTRRTQIDDAQRETTINFVFQLMLDAPNNLKAIVWMVLKKLIDRRSAAQVTRMEHARGLAARS
jgi:hypothetical protein